MFYALCNIFQCVLSIHWQTKDFLSIGSSDMYQYFTSRFHTKKTQNLLVYLWNLRLQIPVNMQLLQISIYFLFCLAQELKIF